MASALVAALGCKRGNTVELPGRPVKLAVYSSPVPERGPGHAVQIGIIGSQALRDLRVLWVQFTD